MCNVEEYSFSGEELPKSIVDLNKKLPDYWGKIKDCWLSAMILIAILYKRDYKVLFFHYVFHYSHFSGEMISLERIVHKHMDIHLNDNNISSLSIAEDEYIYKLLNFPSGYFQTKPV